MNKVILILLFFFLNFVSNAQTEFNFNSYNYGQFQVSGSAQCGIGNVYAIITKSSTTNAYGNYCYQLYFATNSYFYNCQVSRTYIPDIEILYLDGKSWYYPLKYQKFWVTVGQTSLVYTLFHPNPYLQIKIKTGLVEPTIY